MSRTGENIYKRKDGRWEARYIKSYENNKAKYGYLYAKSYKDVKIKLINKKANIKSGNDSTIAKRKNTFNYWLDEWLSISKSRVKESTYIKYHNSIEKHIKPSLGNLNMLDLNTLVLEKFLSSKLSNGNLQTKKGLSPKTVSELLVIIKDTVRYAKSEGVNINCQFDRITIKKKTYEMRVLSVEEEQKLITTLLNNTDRYKLGVLICLVTGIRIGELCALKWENISLSDKTLKINKTMQRIQYPNDNELTKTHIIITDPKSDASNRIIPLPDSLVKLLNSFNSNAESYILSGSSKIYVEPRTMQNKFKNYISESNIKDANFHSLRHTFATRCIELGFDVKSLSEILGHSSVKTTLDKYVHTSFDLKRNNMNKLNLLCG
jgi:integrase